MLYLFHRVMMAFESLFGTHDRVAYDQDGRRGKYFRNVMSGSSRYALLHKKGTITQKVLPQSTTSPFSTRVALGSNSTPAIHKSTSLPCGSVVNLHRALVGARFGPQEQKLLLVYLIYFSLKQNYLKFYAASDPATSYLFFQEEN